MELHVDFGEQKLFQLKKRRIKMRIAICDDDVQLICLLKQLIYRYANEHRYDFVVEEFYSGESLLNSSLAFDIIFLDCKMNTLKQPRPPAGINRDPYRPLDQMLSDTHPKKADCIRFLT